MEITCLALYAFLKEKLQIEEPDPKLADKEIHQIILYTGGSCREHVLYLVTGEDFPEEGMMIQIGGEKTGRWMIRCAEGEKYSVVSCILELFQNFLRWREQCVLLAERDHDPEMLLKLAMEFLPLDSVALFDRDYGIQAEYMSEGFVIEELDMEDGSRLQHNEKVMDNSAMQALYKNDPDFDRTFRTCGICLYLPYSMPVPGGCVYYCNLFQEDFYLGRLVFSLKERGDNRGILKLAEAFCSQVESCCQYIFLHRNKENHTEPLEEIYKRLIKTEEVDLQNAEAVLAAYKWKRKNCYQIFCLAPNGYFHSDQTIAYYLEQLRGILPSVLLTQTEGKIYGLQNRDMQTEPEFHQKLVHFLRENLFKAGFSNVFRDFFEAYRYRCQAEDALSLGNEKDASIWRYDFADYSFDYVRRQCLRQYPAAELCPGNLRTLMEYDRQHPGSELTRTLYQYYISQFNGQLAADHLFIHRTTFFYRLNKIRKIASFHPENPKETAQILLAFQLMDAPLDKGGKT